ncbi:unnamed protein product [Gongylonema pulchrum]|uniref:Uncharacterized protein n=1 Tax=Gongylonema pulchrum TaxID=637853 RepID=A0A3P7NN33_9BILA|nr:unnamed protein product [Gongylonema pulchrum]
MESRGVLLSEEKKMYEEKLLAEAQAREEEHSRYLVRKALLALKFHLHVDFIQ